MPSLSKVKSTAAVAALLAMSCVQPLERNNPADPDGINFTRPDKRVFVTSTSTTGNIGSVATADGICQARANSQVLGGTWKAWLSVSGANAINRIPDARWKLVDGSVVFAKTDEIKASHLPMRPINLDESGVSVAAATEVYTGTLNNGTVASGSTCGLWNNNSSAPGSSRVGDATSVANWTDLGPGYSSCNPSRRLYCFEQ